MLLNKPLELTKLAGTAACVFFVGLRSRSQAPRRLAPSPLLLRRRGLGRVSQLSGAFYRLKKLLSV
jgi:hypothetical protein